MSRRIPAGAALALALALALASIALAASLKKGGLYTGKLARNGEAITVKISSSGRTASASVVFPPVFCQGGGSGERQIAKPAKISSSGAFSQVISYEFLPTHKVTAKVYVKGTFKGKKLTGTARSEFLLVKGCNGTTGFSAKTK